MKEARPLIGIPAVPTYDDEQDAIMALYQDYKDVIEKCKIVSISDLDAEGNTLAVNTYIEKKKQEVVAPEIVRAQYFEALENVKKAEAKMKKLLIEGGYVDEQ